VSDFQNDFAAVEEMFAEAFGVEVIYVVPAASGDTEIPLMAQVSLQSYDALNDYGISETIVSRDYLITNADLGATPESGHRIVETIDGTDRTFEVMPLDKRPCWQPADPDGRQIVIHTKEVA